MPQSLSRIYIHTVFSTKGRQAILDRKIRPDLYSYMSGICKKMDCSPVKIGGYSDHIHILFILSKKMTLIKFMEEVKKSSSKWMKTLGKKYADFYWQTGYGAFSINPSEIEKVIEYIENQEIHHSKKTFQQEYRAFLNKYNVDYDERYVWD